MVICMLAAFCQSYAHDVEDTQFRITRSAIVNMQDQRARYTTFPVTGSSLENAALVAAVEQVAVIFSSIAAMLFFGERITAPEGMGIALITLSMIAVVALEKGRRMLRRSYRRGLPTVAFHQ